MSEMIKLYTHQRGFKLFLELTGTAFMGLYPFKVSNVGELALESLASGRESWVWDRPQDVQQIIVADIKPGRAN